MTIQEIYRRALFARTINDIIDLLGREQVDLSKLKRAYKLKAQLRTNDQEKYRRVAQCLWTRGAMWRA